MGVFYVIWIVQMKQNRTMHHMWRRPLYDGIFFREKETAISFSCFHKKAASWRRDFYDSFRGVAEVLRRFEPVFFLLEEFLLSGN